MSRRPRRKQTGVISTLLVELSALAGIFGIAQPTVRNNLWQMVQPTISSPAEQQAPQEFIPTISHRVSLPEVNLPTAYLPESNQLPYAAVYTAQTTKPRSERNRSVWNASGYNPLGTYQ